MEKIKAVFLDRDGVINRDGGYVCRAEDFEFLSGVPEALAGFSRLGYELFVVTNQSGIGRGYYSLEDFFSLNEYMLDELAKNGVRIRGVYFCPHAPEANCECRKPRAGMILRAASEWDVDLERSIMIGDKDSDVVAGRAAGVGKCYKIGAGVGEYSNLKAVFEAVNSNLN